MQIEKSKLPKLHGWDINKKLPKSHGRVDISPYLVNRMCIE